MTGPVPPTEACPRLLTQDAGTRALTQIVRHAGTNGWISTWGTNAHGEIAGCPPASG
ncbi:hypothetical protein [Janibacter limosus]|uniref:hypothetical protein n=1 Tax=Janibacter limosus TaxID=53458 RepID=UPI0013EE4F6F|nr:hypothetical protein [Janibacter limosus]